MAGALSVSDSVSNAPEQIEHAAKAIGRSKDRRAVFDAIYFNSAKKKTVSEIAKRTRLKRKRVLEEGRILHHKGIVAQTTKSDEIAYQKIDIFYINKKKILQLAGNTQKLAAFPTKRKIQLKLPKSITIPVTSARVRQITIDDVASFSKVTRIKAGASLSSQMSEDTFKRGVQKILGEKGKFMDWGGEANDLYSTRVIVFGKRRAAAFAFKGPGEKGALVPGKMGKNGDQAQRLFQEAGQVFFVQHWREIKPSVITLLHRLAIAKSTMDGGEVFFGVIDGVDSERLRLAYPTKFVASRKKKKSKRTKRKK